MKKITPLILFLLMQFCTALSAAELPVVSNELPSPVAGKAQIVFLKPGPVVYGHMLAEIYELGDSDRQLIGMLDKKTKLILDVEPGKHRFMSVAYGDAHFMEGDFEGGKRYYILARFIMSRGYQLRPIKLNGPEDYSPKNPQFKSWVAETTIIKKTLAMDKAYKSKKKRVSKIQAKSWPLWLARTAEQRAELTMNKEDFID
ncbi:MAG: hypothetical protein ABI644_05345 [Arenimonas sp.]